MNRCIIGLLVFITLFAVTRLAMDLDTTKIELARDHIQQRNQIEQLLAE